MIVRGVKSPKFKIWHDRQGVTKNNGSYWYAKEIEEIIIPKLDTNLLILTAGAILYKKNEIPDGSIVVCHDNRSTEKSYRNLFGKKILWICSKQSTVDKLEDIGERAVYVPLSVDTKKLIKYRKKKTEDTAFIGNCWGFKKQYLESLPKDIAILSGMSRSKLLNEMSKYNHVIAEGRCLMEAQFLGAKCKVPQYGSGIESVFVEVLDSRDAIPFWQEAIREHSDSHLKSRILESIRRFEDLECKVHRKIGDIFLVNQERAEELLSHESNIVKLAE